MAMKRIVLLVALVLAAGKAIAQSPTLIFTLETTATTDKSAVVPRLTWSTTPAATSCTASGTTDWTGTKAAAGTVILSAVSASKTFRLDCNWPGVTKAALSWIAPTQNTDGTPYDNPGGFRIMYGNVSAAEINLTTSFYLEDPAARTWVSPDLAPGTWYFGVKTYNAQGLEAALSNVASKTTTAGATQTRSLGLTVKFPNPVTGLQ